MDITFISDTHQKHDECTKHLGGGSIIVHSGDFMTTGRNLDEVILFLGWYNKLPYTHKVLIAGNHDRLAEVDSVAFSNLVSNYQIHYLQDSFVEIEGIKIYGAPWQPEFFNWAFQFPRNGYELKHKWTLIPDDTDILVTHGPPQGHLDITAPPRQIVHDLGCELLRSRVDQIKPKIHVFGHIHGSYGVKQTEHTTFVNASMLNESYECVNKPIRLNL